MTINVVDAVALLVSVFAFRVAPKMILVQDRPFDVAPKTGTNSIVAPNVRISNIFASLVAPKTIPLAPWIGSRVVLCSLASLFAPSITGMMILNVHNVVCLLPSPTSHFRCTNDEGLASIKSTEATVFRAPYTKSVVSVMIHLDLRICNIAVVAMHAHFHR